MVFSIQKITASWLGLLIALVTLGVSSGFLIQAEFAFLQADLLRQAISIDTLNQTQKPDPNQLYYITGVLQNQQELGDDFLLPSSDYISIHRIVEMYSWHEEIENLENGDEILKYTAKWTDSPPDWTNFQNPNYINPPKTISNEIITAEQVSIKGFTLDISKAGLPPYQNLLLDSSKVNLENKSIFQATFSNSEAIKTTPVIQDNFIYLNQDSIKNPQVGDLRISYKVILPQVVTVVGSVVDNTIVPFVGTDKQPFLKLHPGTIDDFKNSQKPKNSKPLWLTRIAVLSVFWLIFITLLSQIQGILAQLPILAFFVKNSLVSVAFVCALLLATSISVSINLLESLYFYPIVIGILILIVVIWGYLYRRARLSSSQNEGLAFSTEPISRHLVLQRQTAKIEQTLKSKKNSKSQNTTISKSKNPNKKTSTKTKTQKPKTTAKSKK